MDFGAQIRELRTGRDLTQEQFAEKLNITRQAVSNWENDRNLPDIEMLIRTAHVFDISLEELILGGSKMNNMTEKLIDDGRESKRARMNMVSTIIGGILILLGFFCLMIKVLSVEYVDSSGFMHENFFLLPVGYALVICGTVTILGTGIRSLIKKHSIKKI